MKAKCENDLIIVRQKVKSNLKFYGDLIYFLLVLLSFILVICDKIKGYNSLNIWYIINCFNYMMSNHFSSGSCYIDEIILPISNISILLF